jgi:hypothetical protein
LSPEDGEFYWLGVWGVGFGVGNVLLLTQYPIPNTQYLANKIDMHRNNIQIKKIS